VGFYEDFIEEQKRLRGSAAPDTLPAAPPAGDDFYDAFIAGAPLPQPQPSTFRRIAAAAFSPLGRVIDVANRGVYAGTAGEMEFAPELREATEEQATQNPWARSTETLANLLMGMGGLVSPMPSVQPTTALRAMSKVPLPEYAKRATGAVGRGLAGKDKAFTSDVWQDVYGAPEGKAEKFARGTGGFLMDLARDPATWLDFGVITQAGQKARVMGELGDTAAKQAALGQRALVSFAGHPLVYGGKALEPASKLAGAARGTALGQLGQKMFRRGSTNPALNKLLDITGAGHSELDATGQRFAWELRDQAEKLAKQTGRPVDEILPILSEGIETTGGRAASALDDVVGGGASAVESFFERELPDVAAGAADFAMTFRDRMSAELGEQLAAGLRVSDLGEGYFEHLLTKDMKKGLLGLRKKTGAFPQFSNMHAAMKERVLTAGYTSRQFNDIMSTQGLRGIIPDLPDELNFFVKKALEDDAAFVAAHYLRGSARARTGQQLLDGVKELDGVVQYEGLVGQGAIDQLAGMRPIAGVKGLDGFAAPVELADEIERVVGRIIEPQSSWIEKDFIEKFFDPAQNWWKAWTLAPFPAYHTRNVVGNTWNCFLAGMKDPTAFHDAARIEMTLWEPTSKFGHWFKQGSNRALGQAPLDDVARKWSFESFDELSQAAHSRGVLGRGWMSAEVPHGASGYSALSELPGMGKLEGSRLGRYRPGRHFGRESTAVRGGMTVGTIMENNARLALFMDATARNRALGLGLKDSADDAAMTVKKFLFDYSADGVTDFERRVLKRIMPFYTWTRNNVPLQLEYMLKKPRKFGVIGKAHNAYQSLLPPGPPEEYMPEWMQRGYPWRTRQGEHGAEYMLMDRWLPAADIEALSSPGAFGDRLVNLLSPALKVPYELATNYNAYQGRNIRKEIGGKKVEWDTDTLWGQEMSPELAYLLRQSRPVSEFDWLLKGIKGEQSGKATATRAITGKVYPYDWRKQKKSRAWDAREELGDINAELKKRDLSAERRKELQQRKRELQRKT